jgi:hypothetical protein
MDLWDDDFSQAIAFAYGMTSSEGPDGKFKLSLAYMDLGQETCIVMGLRASSSHAWHYIPDDRQGEE